MPPSENDIDEKIASNFLGNIYRKTSKLFGCAYREFSCGGAAPYVTLACQYEQLVKPDQQFFQDKNFLNLCEEEPGQWKSCKATLEATCYNIKLSTTTVTSTATMAAPNPPPTQLPPAPASGVRKTTTKSSPNFKQKILDLHNRKRSLAGVGMLSRDIKKQHEAEKWLSSVCVHPIPICSEPTQNWFFWRPFSDPGKTEAEYAELYFNAIYEEVNPHFLFAGETHNGYCWMLQSTRLDSEVCSYLYEEYIFSELPQSRMRLL